MTAQQVAAEKLRKDIYDLFSTSISTSDLTEILLQTLTKAIEQAYDQGSKDTLMRIQNITPLTN